MAEAKMKVKLLAHTQLSENMKLDDMNVWEESIHGQFSDGQALGLVAIRTCYSSNKPSEIISLEGNKYFGKEATDGKGGSEADRLFRHIFNSKHLSTLEHITFTFAIEGVSRALLAQLTRHRVGFSYSVQSQRYVRFGSDDKSGGFDYVIPEKIANSDKKMNYMGHEVSVREFYEQVMRDLQVAYDILRQAGIAPEDARSILPNAAATNLTMTVNLRALLDFYSKRKRGRGAQAEIANLAEELRRCVVEVEPWLDQFFEAV
jgi:thymidylate synthase (FAD)